MSDKIKVLQVVWRFNTGGAERMVVNFHNYFSNSDDVDIRTLSFTPSQNELWEKELSVNGNVYYMPQLIGMKIPNYFQSLINLVFLKSFRRKWFLKQVSEFAPDVIHIHLANMACELYNVCCNLSSNIRIYYHLHSMPEAVPLAFKQNIRKAIKDKIYNPICVTDLQRQSAVREYGISKNSPVVYNGINTSIFTETKLSDSDKQSLKNELGIDTSNFVIGCVGRGARVKNYEYLAKVASLFAESRKTTLLIVGEVDINLRNRIITISNSANVVFTGQRNDTNRLYRIMDVFVLTSFFESSSIVTVEAQLSGLPCVVSTAVSDEVIISDSVKKASPQDNPTIWAELISETISKKSCLRDWERFDFEHSANTLLKLYKQK